MDRDAQSRKDAVEREQEPDAAKAQWVEPEVDDLAPLTKLTFQTPIGDPIPGDPSVFPSALGLG